MIDDAGFMTMALQLARRGLGRVMPNPAVGCVLVQDGIVIGRGFTQPGGRPHAETVALQQANGRAQGSTAYVTLEPCAHHGRTPPCADALVAAGVRRCVVAIEDPDKRVEGRGIARLRAGGIAVETGLLADKAVELNAGFLSRENTSRPLVTLKLATSLDGKIASGLGESRWITGAAARRYGHLLRREHDAILVGSGTVLADDPSLTVRLPGLEQPSPWRVVMDGRLRTPVTAALVRTARAVPTIIVTTAGGDGERRAALIKHGVELIDLQRNADGVLDTSAMLRALGGRGVTRLLVEGGASIAASLLREGIVDRIAWFHTRDVIGGDGLAAIGAFGNGGLADRVRGRVVEQIALGDDVLETIVLTP